MRQPVIIYTDGSGINNKNKWNSGHGGCGIVLRHKDNQATHSIGKFLDTTSARMEIFAIITALELCNPGYYIKVITDNQYCKNTIQQKWYEKWLQTNDVTKKNLDLWKRYQQVHNHHVVRGGMIEAIWVKGHDGNQYNELADELARKARKSNNEIQDDRNGIYTFKISNTN